MGCAAAFLAVTQVASGSTELGTAGVNGAGYANQVYLGSRGSFRIHGFGEASEVFLGKDLSQINIPEAAQLAGACF